MNWQLNRQYFATISEGSANKIALAVWESAYIRIKSRSLSQFHKYVVAHLGVCLN